MGLIKKANELVIPTTVKMMIYGQAGMGKTTVALSAPKPLLLDFDNGVKRVNRTHLDGVDTVQVSSWQDVKDLFNEDLSSYQTIVTDTVGKMMDFIISYKCGRNQPSIRDWGGINAEFSWFTRAVSELNKHVVFVAHRDTRKEGETTVFVPTLREKSYNSIVTELDLLGYLEMKSERGVQTRTVTFDPTSRNDGKNTCNLRGVMNIPTIVDQQGKPTAKNDFIITQVLTPYGNMLAAKMDEQKKYNAVIEEVKEDIELIVDAQSANDFASRVKEFDHVGSSLAMTKKLFVAKVKELELVYDSAAKMYSDPISDVKPTKNSLL
ncbi:MAG: ATP-binding protein [Phocaeicola sp.]